MSKRHVPVLWRSIVCLVMLAAWLAATPATAQEAFLPELTRPVNDFAGVIRPGDAAEMTRQIEALQQATGDVAIVATVPTFEPFADIREYAVKLFENRGRGIGEKGKDNGLLVLLAVNDRRVWVEVGYGLEGFITDGFAGETSRQYMVPAFRQGDYSAGLRAGLTRLIGRIADGRQVTLEGVKPVRRRAAPSGQSIGPIVFIFIVLLIVALNSISGGPRYRRRGFWGHSRGWSGWNSGIGPFGGGGGFGGGGFGGGFGGFGGGRSGGGGGGAGW